MNRSTGGIVSRNQRHAALADHMNLIVVSSVILLATALTLFSLGEESLWFDEARTVLFSRDWASLWQTMTQVESNMWLYYVLLHVWLNLGENEFLIRSLSAIFAVATVPVIYALSRRLFGSRVGMIAALLLAVNPFFIHYAQEARSYSLTLLLVALSSFFFARSIERPSWRHWVGYIISSALAIYGHFFGALVLIAQAVSLVFLHRREVPWRSLAISGMSIALLLLPLILLQPLDSSQIDYILQPDVKSVGGLFKALAGDRYSLFLLYSTLCFIALVFAVIELPRFRPSLKIWRYAFVLTWLLMPVAITFSFSLLVKPVWLERYLIICLPPFVLLAAVGLSKIGYRWLFVAALTTLLVFSGCTLFAWYTNYKKEDWGNATAFVLSEAQSGDAVLFFGYFVRQPFEYYLEKLDPQGNSLKLLELASGPYSPGGATYMPDPDRDLLEHLPDKHPRVWLVLSHVHVGDLGYDAQSCLIQSLLDREYDVARERKFKGIRVLLYERSSLELGE